MTHKKKLYNIGKNIGLNKEEIDEIIKPVSDNQLTDSEKLTLQNSTETYLPGALYGTVSIKDF